MNKNNLKNNPKKLVYIAGSGHSGSTLLDALLGGNDQVSNLGEVHRFSLSLIRDSDPFVCTCGKPVVDCPFWKKVINELSGLQFSSYDHIHNFVTTNPKYNKLRLDAQDADLEMVGQSAINLNINNIVMILGFRMLWSALEPISSSVRMNRLIIRNSLILYEAVRKSWGTPTIIDSTKTPIRLKGLAMLSDIRDFHILRLLRDGRAVCYSRMRRQNLSMEDCVHIWKTEQLKLRLVMLSLPKDIVTVVRYEDLCTEPHEELKRICQALRLPYQSKMVDFRENEIHSIGGNPMRFRYSDKEIRLDEKWKEGLTKADLLTFERLGGKINRRLGYL